jgi:hypothetical protein
MSLKNIFNNGWKILVFILFNEIYKFIYVMYFVSTPPKGVRTTTTKSSTVLRINGPVFLRF